jgi:glycosyltransferase involved in cell wall biosynthesis
MIENRDIVIVGIQPWNIEIGSNCKNIAMEMSKHNRVLYINPPLGRLSYLREANHKINIDRANVIKGKKEPLTSISNNLWEYNPKTIMEPINKISFNFLFDSLNRMNSKRFSKEINKAVAELGFRNYILFNDSSMFIGNYLDEYLNYDSQIYYIRDNLINSPNPYWNTQGKRMEERIIKKADVVVTNSTYYCEYAKNYNSSSFMVGQGCDTSMFDFKNQSIITSAEFDSIKQPIIGYVGSITEKRLDIELIKFIAVTKPNWSIVLVGPEDESFKNSNLHQIENIHFLGSKPEKNLPQYINGFDVCLNPQLLNNTTIGNYPRKIDEYLVMGKPVVATKTKAMEYFSDHTYLGVTKEDYVALIQKALDEDSTELACLRREFGLTHSWKNNVDEIWKALHSVKINTINNNL